MSNALEQDAMNLLGLLCERHDQLSAPAHTAVMEAFNVCADVLEVLPAPSQPAVDPPIHFLMVEASAALNRLADSTADLGAFVAVQSARRLVDAARRQS